MQKKILGALGIIILLPMSAYSEEINLCRNYILEYKNNHSDNFYFREARVDSLLDLLDSSVNKYDLINNIFLHYYSIENSESLLSKKLELCLCELININKNIIVDKIFKKITSNVLNNKFLQIYENSLRELRKLSNQEENIICRLFLKKSDFDDAIKADIGPEIEPGFIKKLMNTYTRIADVIYDRHDVFYTYNISLVDEFMKLITRENNIANFEKLLNIYKRDPSNKNYNNIKAYARKLTKAFTGDFIPISESELWEQVLLLLTDLRLEQDIIDKIISDYDLNIIRNAQDAIRQLEIILGSRAILDKIPACSQVRSCLLCNDHDEYSISRRFCN
jgi:hypothetical protein